MALQEEKTVRAILYKCVTCKKSQSGTLIGLEPSRDLPKSCLDFDYTFSNTGVDSVGHLYIKDIYGKNHQMFKVPYVYFVVRLQGIFILN